MQVEVENNIVKNIIYGPKNEKLILVPNHVSIKKGHDIRIFSEDFSRELSLEELMEKGIFLKRRFLYESEEKFFLRELSYTEPHVSNETNIIPPIEKCLKGEIPIFVDDHWEITKNTFWIPRTIEINYNAGRPVKSLVFDRFIFFDVELTKRLPPIKEIPLLFAPLLSKFLISQKIQYIHREMLVLKNNFENKDLTKWDILYSYKDVLETVIFHMKRVIDSLVQLTSVLVNYDDIRAKHKLTVDSLGLLLGNPKKYEESKIIIGDDIYSFDNTSFLYIINNLFNSFKHCLIHSESYLLFGREYPTILTDYAKQNDYTKIMEYHNHNAYHILMGFQDTIIRITDNMKKYYELELSEKSDT